MANNVAKMLTIQELEANKARLTSFTTRAEYYRRRAAECDNHAKYHAERMNNLEVIIASLEPGFSDS